MIRRRRNNRLIGWVIAGVTGLALAHGHTPPTGGTATATPASATGCGGSNEALANCMAATAPYDWTGGQATCLDELWTRESNFETGATNPQSGAYGIPQSLPASKMAAAGADWQTNPATQVRWGLGYIAATYGSPCNAWSHEEAVSWY